MQQLRDSLLSKGGLTAIGSGIALIGSYFIYKNIKETIQIDKIAQRIEIDQELFAQSGYIGRKQLLQILSESIEIAENEVKLKEQNLFKQGLQYLQEKEYEEYADILLEFESFKVQKQIDALKQLREHLGISEEVFKHNLSQQHKTSQIQQSNFVEEYKQAVNDKQIMLYKDEVQNSSLLKMDFLSFKFLVEEQLCNILQNNQKIFDIVIKRIIDQKPPIDLLYPSMETLAYHLFYLNTHYSQHEVKYAQMKFKTIFSENKNENSKLLNEQLNTFFSKLEKSIASFLQVRHQKDIQNMTKK